MSNAVVPINDSVKVNERPARKKRERIELIEERPDPSWFARSTDDYGRPVWFLRFHVTGLKPRRYGPFPSQRKALLFLDMALNEMMDTLDDIPNHLDRYQVRHQFQHVDPMPRIEDKLASAYLRRKDGDP